MLRKHLVIVGGGWAGLSLIRSLKKTEHTKLRITLISDEPNFRYSPGLYRVATGHREREAIIPIGEALDDIANTDFVLDRAKKIDRKKKIIVTESGKTFHYDFAVLCLGMTTSYFGIPGIKENSFTIKTASGIEHFREHLHQELIADKKLDKNYVVIGAGPTGVELSAALGSYLRKTARWHGLSSSHLSIDLIDASPRVVPSMPEKVSKKVHARLKTLGIHVATRSKVESESSSTLSVNGKSIPTHTVVWTAGVTNNPFFKQNEKQFTFNEKGKIIVDGYLQVDQHTYVIGDNAATQYSGLALTAVHNARFVASDIKKQLSQRARKTYNPLKPISVLPVGSNWAIMQYGPFVVSGFLGSVLRSFADFIGYMDVFGFWKALELWTSSGSLEEQCAICRTKLSHTGLSSEILETN